MKIEKKYKKEIDIFTFLSKKYSGEKKSFEEVFKIAKTIRIKEPFNLKPYEELTKKTQGNFENRLARFLGGTKESSKFSNSIQAETFNIENILGKKCTDWVFPINPSEKLSPQVKKDEQKFRFPI
ncbi:hypothetical protein G1L01_05955 [Tenacibaculum finnmarkense]|uniref:Uncharacterized protein n=1 Tax=Tenacibaculum finnmarkense genomovar finnmarkense TaxID=1458503 RepID=A0AAP1WHB6_9FLAO|nr:hypothetical protein [Tenacibaculum finnmarkense]MBE7653930.1 hypothetical protein [Tenacibaculum finnmarkense genomovar finnmarkense]MBE7696232.1 hypothetical protein [Tenacibaculum finnmarkense genomovar finnmarkense]MCD8428475.1 hypothetical protein [Tenacibaculum finnmarkense genomovar finnmarkense]MCG8202165.1 hypothetical protein [Tenacibaculum finnmarkense genomovar finnmarkense]MCG8732249.1 hypothetical protein [Tenacibaculum finnmarkense]